MFRHLFAAFSLSVSLLLLFTSDAFAGMPAVLPSSWTADSPAPSAVGGVQSAALTPFLQAISFFVVVLLLSAWGVKGLWSVVRRDVSWLPTLSYGRSLAMVMLWGLLFVVVLTMISGARELMTPGAWRKQGWTYKLAEPAVATSDREVRTKALERLRHSLWHYAATHEGRFPSANVAALDSVSWDVPGWPGLRFLYVDGQLADSAGKLLVFEPDLDGGERLVLLTNGMIGSMRSAEISRAIPAEEKP